MPRLYPILLLVAGLLAGCGPRDRNGDAEGSGSGVDLQVVKYDELMKEIGRRRGKVVVVDLWATWCEPCREEFPHFVELHRTYAAEVSCVAVSLDRAKDRARALDF